MESSSSPFSTSASLKIPSSDPSLWDYITLFFFRPFLAISFSLSILIFGWFLAWKLVLVHVPLVQEIFGMRKKPVKPKPEGRRRLTQFYNSIDTRDHENWQSSMLVKPNGFFIKDMMAKESLLTERKYGSVVKRVFLLCEKDPIVEEEFQRFLINNSPPEEVKSIAQELVIWLCSRNLKNFVTVVYKTLLRSTIKIFILPLALVSVDLHLHVSVSGRSQVWVTKN